MFPWKMFKQACIALLRISELIVGMPNDTNFTACISWNNYPYKTRPTLTDLNPHQGLC